MYSEEETVDYSDFEPVEERVQPIPELTDDERYEQSLRLPQGTVPTNNSNKSNSSSRKNRSKDKRDYKPWQKSARMVRHQKQTVITAWDDNHGRAFS